MKQHYRSASRTGLMLALVLSAVVLPTHAWRPALPDRLTNEDFWRLTEELSEPGGYFRSDNLLSNEIVFARVLPLLGSRVKAGGVYLGVGPEQNFTYMAATKPRLAFILDIRRGNLHTQLLYKALFEVSADRADFVARLFTRSRPPGLSASATARDLMDAYWDRPAGDVEEFEENLQTILTALADRYQLPLSAGDRDGIRTVYQAFHTYGPAITWSSSSSGSGGGRATYRDLMVQMGPDGGFLSYLSSEEKFRYLKDLERRNLVVPIVGNFAGPKALRAIGDYLRRRSATVSVFYLSNVEQYLRQDGIWPAFCANVATLPLDESSVFIRPSGSGIRSRVSLFAPASRLLRPSTSQGGTTPPVTPMLPETANCSADDSASTPGRRP